MRAELSPEAMPHLEEGLRAAAALRLLEAERSLRGAQELLKEEDTDTARRAYATARAEVEAAHAWALLLTSGTELA